MHEQLTEIVPGLYLDASTFRGIIAVEPQSENVDGRCLTMVEGSPMMMGAIFGLLVTNLIATTRAVRDELRKSEGDTQATLFESAFQFSRLSPPEITEMSHQLVRLDPEDHSRVDPTGQ